MKTLIIFLLTTAFTFCQSDDYAISGPVYAIAPTLVGGLGSLYSHFKWPESAQQIDIEGSVYVLAFLDSLGNLDSAKVIKGFGFGFDEEVLRAVKLCKFTPGYTHKVIISDSSNIKSYRLYPIKSQMYIPITIRLK